ncbi:MAG: hypothetical protein H8E53_08935 [Planctomycetes bacterium]|nr:hypothetical protein [Planctomycetota bacterium]
MLLILVVFCGCISTFKTAASYHNYSHIVSTETRGWAQLNACMNKDHILFRLRFTKGVLFTFSMWTEEYLEFVVNVEDLKPGKRLMLSNLNAWSIAGAYIEGAGRLKEGEVTIKAVSTNLIEIHINAPELPSKFDGDFTFKVRDGSVPDAIKGRHKSREEAE